MRCPRCGTVPMIPATLYRWRCRSCRYVTKPDHPKYASERANAPRLPGFECGNGSDTLATEVPNGGSDQGDSNASARITDE